MLSLSLSSESTAILTPDDALATRANRLGRVGCGCLRLEGEVGEEGEGGGDGEGAPVANNTLPTSFNVLLSTLSSCEAFGDSGLGGEGARGGRTLRGATKNVSAHVGRTRLGGAGAAGGFFG